MPELLEVELYRRLAESAIGRPISTIEAPDQWYLKGDLEPAELRRLEGQALVGTRRIGKLLLLDTAGADVLGLRFGMTGSLEVDGRRALERLEYTSPRPDPAWDRFIVRFRDGGDLRIRDPRRLGGVALDPDLSVLGPDALSVTPSQLRRAVAGSDAPLKARLLDQSRLAGVGNLLADEVLWRASLDPTRPAGSLSDAEVRRLHRHLRVTLEELMTRGGSHTGDLMAERGPGGHCPRDGAPLRRSTVGGRTTWWCPVHQR